MNDMDLLSHNDMKEATPLLLLAVHQVNKVKIKGLGLNNSYLIWFLIFFHSSVIKSNPLAKKSDSKFISLV